MTHCFNIFVNISINVHFVIQMVYKIYNIIANRYITPHCILCGM